ncbi:MAG: C40 family peptidase [Thermodesulfobacteriota bacterium]
MIVSECLLKKGIPEPLGILGKAGNQSIKIHGAGSSMIIRIPSKVVLVLLISILYLAAEPAMALAGAAKSSRFLQRSSRMCRTPQGGPGAPSRIVSTNAARGPLRRISAHRSPLPKTQRSQVIPKRIGRDLLAPRSLRGPLAFRPRSTSPPKRVSTPSTSQSKRCAANNPKDRILTQAYNYLGTPYRRGGSLETGNATDCSGFVQFIYQQSNIDLPRSSSEQSREGQVVSRTLNFARLLPGDLLFFGNRSRHINHVGIYLGDGKMIHASNSHHKVVISDLREEAYLQGAFVVAKRIPEAQSHVQASQS